MLSRSIRPCESMHGHAQTFSEEVIASIIYDSRSGMSDVAFRTTGGCSCIDILSWPLTTDLEARSLETARPTI